MIKMIDRLLSILKAKTTTMVAIVKCDVIESKTQTGNVGGKIISTTWNYVSLCFRMKGHQYSKLQIQTEDEGVHTKFEPGKEYVIAIFPKDEAENYGLTKDQYGFYDKK